MQKRVLPFDVVKGLFVITVIFLSGTFLGYNIEKVIGFLIGKVRETSGFYSLWIIGVICCVIAGILGIYLFLVKKQTVNWFLLIYLFFSTLQLNLAGTKLSWMFSGIGLNFEIFNYGMGINLVGLVLAIWYERIIYAEKKMSEKLLVEEIVN